MEKPSSSQFGGATKKQKCFEKPHDMPKTSSEELPEDEESEELIASHNSEKQQKFTYD